MSGINPAVISAFRSYVSGLDSVSDAELSQALTQAATTVDRQEAARVLGITVDASKATRGSGILGGVSRYTGALKGSGGMSQIEIAAKAFLLERLSPEAAAAEWKNMLKDVMSA